MRISWVPNHSARSERLPEAVLGAVAFMLVAAGPVEAGFNPVPATTVFGRDEPAPPAIAPMSPERPDDAWVCIPVVQSLPPRAPGAGAAPLPEAQPLFLTTYTQAVASLDVACRDDRPARPIRFYTWRSAHDEPQASVPIPPAAWSGFACLAALAGFKVLRRRSLRSE